MTWNGSGGCHCVPFSSTLPPSPPEADEIQPAAAMEEGGAAEADAAAKGLAVHGGMLQVWQETATRLVIRVADIIAGHDGLAGDLAAFGHRAGSYLYENRRAQRGHPAFAAPRHHLRQRSVGIGQHPGKVKSRSHCRHAVIAGKSATSCRHRPRR